MRMKTKRRICGWIAVISFFLAIGFAGGMELGSLSLTKGLLLMSVSVFAFAVSAYTGGYFS